MDNYLKHYSWGKDMNNSLFHAHSQAKISGLNESKHYSFKLFYSINFKFILLYDFVI